MRKLALAALLSLTACSHLPQEDISQGSVAAGVPNLPLAVSGPACNYAPAPGLTLCRVMEGAPVREQLILVPPPGLKGEIQVRRGAEKIGLPITGPTVTLDLRALLGHDTYQLQDDQIIQITGTLQAKSQEGPVWVDLLGEALLIVTSKGYEPLSIDSGYSAFKGNCAVQYSTSGRLALQCPGQP